MTTSETTSHSAKSPTNGDQAAGYSHLTDETTGKTTDMTTSHLTNPANDTGQVIGYSHPTKQPEDVCQEVGYSHSTRLSKDDNLGACYAAFRKKFLACR